MWSASIYRVENDDQDTCLQIIIRLENADVQYTVVEYNMVRYVYSAAVETERRSDFKLIIRACVSVCVRTIFVLIFLCHINPLYTENSAYDLKRSCYPKCNLK